MEMENVSVKQDEVVSAPVLHQWASSVFERSGFRLNPYFTALHEGDMSLESFRISQRQFSYAVSYFARAMSALVFRIPQYGRRIDILHNVWEEHGEGLYSACHETSIRNFLRSIGAEVPSEDNVSLAPTWPGVRAFNNQVASACMLDEVEVGIACMGMIEYSFIWVSNAIARGVVARGWLASDERIWHYALHEDLDPKHAADFFVILEPQLDDPIKRHHIQQGMQLGCYAFNQLYRALWDGERYAGDQFVWPKS